MKKLLALLLFIAIGFLGWYSYTYYEQDQELQKEILVLKAEISEEEEALKKTEGSISEVETLIIEKQNEIEELKKETGLWLHEIEKIEGY
ncbi:MAG: hypothetical protein IIZ33_04635 [Erysipelotrichaceae bacterium]|nr:hypothetical protein [Erysipelotrichaceae bacterium]